ncbi:MAG: SH3 domain-containing protein [Lachnospiraceae bacterium]|nr:SH3 domain-containing protein [Lachnospiraceae bacterium]
MREDGRGMYDRDGYDRMPGNNRRVSRENMNNGQYRSGTVNSTMKRRRVSKKQRRREMLRALLPPLIVIIVFIVAAAVVLGSGMLDSLKYSSQKADLYSYYNISDEERAVIVKDGEITEETMMISEGRPYVLLNDINGEFNDRFYYDVESDSFLYTRGDKIDHASLISKTILYKGEEKTVDYSPYIKKGDDIYMALDYLKLYKNISYELYGGNGQPYRMRLREEEGGSRTVADMVKDQSVRIAEDKKSEVLEELKEGDVLTVLDKGEEWSKVETSDLIIGYIENKFLSETRDEAVEPVNSVTPEVIPSNSIGKPVVLTWHNVVGNSGADAIRDILAKSQGVNVISPTWFTITDDNGSIESIGSKSYVDICHEAGVQVWGLFDNLQHLEVSSYEVFSSASKRKNVISQLLSYAAEYGLDGINIDIETIPTESGEHFAQFIRELSIECHAKGLILSVDNYVPMGYNDHYNRPEQGVFADYVIIMGYDEHYVGSKKAGSVASIGYVKSGIENTVSTVPSQKVINAVPLYTRLWIETPKTQEQIDEEKITFDEAGNEIAVEEEDIVPYTLEVQTLKMGDGIATANANSTIAWDEETQQNYATWVKGGKTYEIWLEDRESLMAKLEVMKDNDLGGVAAWQVNYAEDYVWDLFRSYY